MNKFNAIGILGLILVPASWVAAATSQQQSTDLMPASSTTLGPLRLSLSTEPKVPKPVACEREDSQKAEHVLIRIGRNGDELVVVPTECKVAAGAVVTLVPDTTLDDVEVRFVVPAADGKCTGATKGQTPDDGSNTVFAPPNLPGPALPMSFTVSDKPPAGSRFPYCAATGGGIITPYPAIIIKPD